MLSTIFPLLVESWLYRGGKKVISEHRGIKQLNFASLGVDDPIGYRLDTRGVGVGAHAVYFLQNIYDAIIFQ